MVGCRCLSFKATARHFGLWQMVGGVRCFFNNLKRKAMKGFEGLNESEINDILKAERKSAIRFSLFLIAILIFGLYTILA